MKSIRMGLALLFLATVGIGTGFASTLVPQTWLPGECIPQFATALPVFGSGYNAALPRVNALLHPALSIKMVETERQVLPAITTSLFVYCPRVPIQKPTRVFAYETSDAITGKLLGPAFWPAVTVETRRFVPTLVRYENDLPSFNEPFRIRGVGFLPYDTTGKVQGLVSVDQSIHWANPLGDTGPENCMDPLSAACSSAYKGPVPAVPHLHGGEVPSQFDGGPEAWFTPGTEKGPSYSSLWPVGPGKAVYLYPNSQEPGTPWFHDHALGATRTNVYSGMAAFYFIRDPAREPKNLPGGAYEIEMAIQDRQFDTNSQLFWPDGSGANAEASNLNGTPPNPGIHPFWIPEFIGDTVVVNGSPWPYFNVEPRRYRFRIVEGSNARFYNLNFGGAPVYVIGSDDAYLDKPVKVDTVFIAPGERADIIVDFSKVTGNITVTNNARVPFPDGPDFPGDAKENTDDFIQPQMAKIMQFRVTLPVAGRDTSCNPATGGCTRPDPMVRLTNGNGHLKSGVKIDKVRQLVLKEHAGFDAAGETGPLEVLVNNTKYEGLMSPGAAIDFPTDGVSELPRVGSTELWEIINTTADAHPMHTHLVQFQILNRQDFNADDAAGYPAVWAAAFPVSCGTTPDPTNPCPGYGPPKPYKTPNADGALGGNPAISPYLLGSPTPPDPWESGWKDTAKVMPGQVLRIVARWAPTGTAVSLAKPGRNFFPFDPTVGPGYVWHCHIVDHEDNDMMRPYKVVK